MKRHAYLILAHKNPRQLRKLIALLDDPRNDIFVHVDRKATFRSEDWTRTCRHSGLYFLDRRIRVNWGGVSIMRCELALLEAAAARGRYDYYHLLSGMDLPIKDQDTIHQRSRIHQLLGDERGHGRQIPLLYPFPGRCA